MTPIQLKDNLRKLGRLMAVDPPSVTEYHTPTTGIKNIHAACEDKVSQLRANIDQWSRNMVEREDQLLPALVDLTRFEANCRRFGGLALDWIAKCPVTRNETLTANLEADKEVLIRIASIYCSTQPDPTENPPSSTS